MFEAQVRRGVAVLDGYEPGWRARVDVGTLDMASYQLCVLGQVFGSFDRAPVELLDPDDMALAASLGFDLRFAPIGERPTTEERFAQLTREWRAAITSGPVY